MFLNKEESQYNPNASWPSRDTDNILITKENTNKYYVSKASTRSRHKTTSLHICKWIQNEYIQQQRIAGPQTQEFGQKHFNLNFILVHANM